MTDLELVAQIKNRARELGFAACGIASLEPVASHSHLEEWLASGFHAEMNWMAKPESVWKREDAHRVLDGAQTAICVALHYRTEEIWDEASHGKVARYARGVDYHDVIVPRLRELLAFIQKLTPCNGRAYSDTGPILERDLARRAGIGWVGKNTMLLSRELGSYFLIGELLIDIELPSDRPHWENFCGSCTRCMDACPTQAFEAPVVLDANKCISYQTIESRERLPNPSSTRFGDWAFGCDICQEVCPWNNKSAARSQEITLWSRDDLPTLHEMLFASQAELSPKLRRSPLKRAKRRGLRRNALAVLKNRRAGKLRVLDVEEMP